jgi:hypothetical protein
LSGPGRGELWAIRDDRALSAHAKLAWFILLSRQPNCWPSLRTLAADMRVSKPTAIKAVRDLQKAGIVKILSRVTAAGDADTNLYVLEGGGKGDVPPVVHDVEHGGKEMDPKVSTEALQALRALKALGLPAGANWTFARAKTRSRSFAGP